MMNGNDFRAAAGLNRWPADPADLGPDEPPRGRGLFAVVKGNGEELVTNVRRLAGSERGPGSGLVLAATVLLGLLAAGLFLVTLNAQYKYVFAAKGQQIPAVIEAASLDLGMAIFTLLALGLAMAKQPARIERALIVACAVGSAGQNYAAADVSSPRSVAAYVVPSLFLALVVDRTVAVVRRHALGAGERSVWSTVGRAAAVIARGLGLVLLYALRFVLAPPSTGAGLRRVVLNAAPVPAPPVRLVLEADEPKAELPPPPPPAEPAELAGASKKARLAWWYEQDPGYGNRSAVAAAAKRLAPKVDLSEGTARAYLGQICDALEQDRRPS
ncbi:MAG TPA: hypothetical protein VFQ68_19140 [Streptosporangiaceae bacterium]|nr:hypothetical protein [Streptosporangiaceae bacterium]